MKRDEMRSWLVKYVAELLEFDPSEVETAVPLSRYGLDSVAAAALTDELGSVLGRKIDPAVLYEHRTIDALATFLAGKE